MSNPTSALDLVIFDCDGVLIDSERITNRVFAQMLGELGLTVSEEYMAEQFFGRSAAESVRRAEQLLVPPLPPGFGEHFWQRSRGVIALAGTPMPGDPGMFISLS